MEELPIDRKEHQLEELNSALFSFESVDAFLQYLIKTWGNEKGFRTKLAKAAGCQPSYLSQVLCGQANLSTDQLFGMATYLQVDGKGWEYLRELCLLERAGTHGLKEDCRQRILQLRHGQNLPPKSGRTEGNSGPSLSSDESYWYVSQWQISAIMAATSYPGGVSVRYLSEKLTIPYDLVCSLVDQLATRGFLKPTKPGHFCSSMPERIRLGEGTAGQIFRMNWVVHGLAKTQSGYHSGLQKGGVFRASPSDYANLKSKINKVLAEFFSRKREPSPDDHVGYFGVDLFEA